MERPCLFHAKRSGKIRKFCTKGKHWSGVNSSKISIIGGSASSIKSSRSRRPASSYGTVSVRKYADTIGSRNISILDLSKRIWNNMEQVTISLCWIQVGLWRQKNGVVSLLQSGLLCQSLIAILHGSKDLNALSLDTPILLKFASKNKLPEPP